MEWRHPYGAVKGIGYAACPDGCGWSFTGTREEVAKVTNRRTCPPETKALIEAVRRLIETMEEDGGYTTEAEAQMRRDFPHDPIGEPWEALRAVREALAKVECDSEERG